MVHSPKSDRLCPKLRAFTVSMRGMSAPSLLGKTYIDRSSGNSTPYSTSTLNLIEEVTFSASSRIGLYIVMRLLAPLIGKGFQAYLG
jgi:hypothetical protein